MSDYSDHLDAINEEKIEAILNDPDFPSFAVRFFNAIADTRSSSTRLEYAYDIRNFFLWLKDNAGKYLKIDDEPAVLDHISIDGIQDYLKTLRIYTGKDGKKHKTSMATRARKIISLRTFFRYYYRIKAIKTDFAAFLDVPEIPDVPIVDLDKDEVKRYLKAISDTSKMTKKELIWHKRTEKRDLAIAITLLGTGLRVSELVGLDVNDIDFYQAKMIVKRKGGDLDEVFFGMEVQEALENYIDNERSNLISSPSETALFLSNYKKRMTVRAIQIMVKKYSERAGIVNKKVTPHKFRKTYGTNLYEETGDIYLVAEALHHSSVETTRKHYAKMSEDHKRIAAQKSSTLFQDD